MPAKEIDQMSWKSEEHSPDLNPIEEMWSKIKAYLRKVKAHASEDLENAIRIAFSTVSPSDIAGWFVHSGYSYS